MKITQMTEQAALDAGFFIPDRRPTDPGGILRKEERQQNLRKVGYTFPGDKGHMTKTYKAVFSVGVGKDKDNFSIPFATALNYRQFAVSYAAGLFGGVTVTENYGGWNNNGFLVTEESWDFIVVSNKRDKFREFAVYLRELYRQSAVMMVVSEVESEFV
jgi:hypothetical protein